MTAAPPPSTNGARHRSREDSRFFRNRARTVSLVLLVVAIAALVIGAVLAEVSASGTPSSTATDVVRWVIVASLAGGAVAYVIGGRQQRG